MRLIEPYAGLGAFSLRCLWEAAGSDPRIRWEPPVSRQGSKSGFVVNEFRAFGLVRQKWDAVLLNDLDPVCHLFHLIYTSTPLRDAVARRLWAWVPCPECLPHDVEAALAGTLRPSREWCRQKWVTLHPAGRSCDECSGTGVQDARRLWERVRKAAVPDEVEDRAAQAVFLQSRSFGLKPVSVGDGRWMGLFENGSRTGALADFKPDDGGCGSDHNVRDTLAGKLLQLPSSDRFQAIVSRMDAAQMLPEGDCAQTVVILDPPYEGTSGYQASSCRETVLTLARAWHEAGALVLLHEACPLADALGDGWQSRPAGVLRGRASTFWGEGGEREWLTFNRKPVWWPAEQSTMFGGGR